MPPKKRTAAEADSEEPATESKRAPKVAKTSKAATNGEAKVPKPKAAPKPKKEKPEVMARARFTASALPIHMHLTHTPPSATAPATEGGSSSTEPNKQTDPGHITSIVMSPCTFSTGTYGWKSSTPVFIEVTDPESGKKTKLSVQIGINAPVKGSKGAKDEQDEGAGAKTTSKEADGDDVEKAVAGDEEDDDDDDDE